MHWRRAIFRASGAPVVHGVHAVLWALDKLAGDIDLSGLAGITVSLNRFIYLNRPVSVQVARRDWIRRSSADVVADGVTVITLLLKLAPPAARQRHRKNFLTMAPAAAMDRAATTPRRTEGRARLA